MISIRPSDKRGITKIDWLDSKHSFSFGYYYDPNYMGFSTLRVINEDKVSKGGGFGTHSHRDMEIVSYVIEGELEHKDSLGNGSVIRPGDVQRMSAGTGIAHSEFNASSTNPVHFLQIWILPDTKNLTPSYEQKYFPREEKLGKLKLVGSQNGRNDSITIHQDLNLYVSILNQDQSIDYSTEKERNIWLQVVKGMVKIKDQILSDGDGAAIVSETQITIISLSDESEFLLFDLR
jgi:redox-sensitive bicupin YhaK (pirin superfamily)